MSPAQPTGPTGAAWPRSATVLVALGSLAPLLWLQRDFATLFWFGDEYDLIDQIDRVGLWRWTWSMFAENFVPLFKVAWGGLVLASGGSYFALLVALWLTHAVNAVLFGRLLRIHGFGWPGVVLALALFALSPTHTETLGWTVQWSAVLAHTFLLLGLLRQAQVQAQARTFSAGTYAPLLLCGLASAWCFSRGVLTGALLALTALLPPFTDGRWTWRMRHAGLCLVPAVATAGLILALGGGATGSLGSHWPSALAYAAGYFSLNPFFQTLGLDSWGPRTFAVCALLKLGLVVWGLRQARGPQRNFLLLLLACDLGNAVLLGIGRFHTGLETAVSSRYQYVALFCTAPFLGLALEAAAAALRPGWRRLAMVSAVLSAVLAVLASSWPRDAEVFVTPRGKENRALMLDHPNPPPGSVPGIDFISPARARELIRKYRLH